MSDTTKAQEALALVKAGYVYHRHYSWTRQFQDVLAALDELDAKQVRIAELEAFVARVFEKLHIDPEKVTAEGALYQIVNLWRIHDAWRVVARLQVVTDVDDEDEWERLNAEADKVLSEHEALKAENVSLRSQLAAWEALREDVRWCAHCTSRRGDRQTVKDAGDRVLAFLGTKDGGG